MLYHNMNIILRVNPRIGVGNPLYNYTTYDK